MLKPMKISKTKSNLTKNVSAKNVHECNCICIKMYLGCRLIHLNWQTCHCVGGSSTEEQIRRVFDDNFLQFSIKTYCRYSLESPQQGNSNEYPQHKFLWRKKQNYPLIYHQIPFLSVLLHRWFDRCSYISEGRQTTRDRIENKTWETLKKTHVKLNSEF